MSLNLPRAAALLVLALTLTSVSNAVAQGRGGDTVHFVTHLSDPGDYLTIGGIDPTCQVGQVGIRGTAHLTGQMRAIDNGAGCLSWDPVAQLDDLRSSDQPGFVMSGYVDDHADGTLDGCGKGTLTMRLHDLKVTSFDPAAHTVHLSLKWTVTPGSGTGAFRGATGQGTGSLDGTFTPDPSVPLLTAPVTNPNWGSYEGTIDCPHRVGAR